MKIISFSLSIHMKLIKIISTNILIHMKLDIQKKQQQYLALNNQEGICQ